MDKRELFTTAFPPLDDAAARSATLKRSSVDSPRFRATRVRS